MVSAQDTVARWGGDEFAVLVENVPDAQEIGELAEDRLVVDGVVLGDEMGHLDATEVHLLAALDGLERAGPYGRGDVIASNASATASTRANSGISSPARPIG